MLAFSFSLALSNPLTGLDNVGVAKVPFLILVRDIDHVVDTVGVIYESALFSSVFFILRKIAARAELVVDSYPQQPLK